MKIKITPTEKMAAQLKDRAGNCYSSLSSLERSGMASLAAGLRSQRERPVSDFINPVEVELDRTGFEDLETLGQKAIFCLGFRKIVAVRRETDWIASLEIMA